MADPNHLPVPGTQHPAKIDQNSNFVFADMLPGKYYLDVLAGGLYVDSIRPGNADVLADGLSVGTAPPPEVEIILRSGGGSITGTIEGLSGTMPATVLLVRQTGASGIPIEVQAFGGRFTANNLPPGDYSLYAWPLGRQIEYLNPQVLANLGVPPLQVTLREGGNESVTVKTIPGDAQ
jgi:hypothetical protein